MSADHVEQLQPENTTEESQKEVSQELQGRKLSLQKLRRYGSLDIESGKVHGHHGHASKGAEWSVILQLAFQSLGVVYGDIGTSPLYVYTSTFSEGTIKHNDDILGVLSLIFYTLTLIPLIKYVFIVLRANDNGDEIAAFLHPPRFCSTFSSPFPTTETPLSPFYSLSPHHDGKVQQSGNVTVQYRALSGKVTVRYRDPSGNFKRTVRKIFSVVGATVIILDFYGVIWAQSNEDDQLGEVHEVERLNQQG